MSWWSAIAIGSKAPAGRRGRRFRHKWTAERRLKHLFNTARRLRAFVLYDLAFLVRLLCGKIKPYIWRKPGELLGAAAAAALDRDGLVEAHLYLIEPIARRLAQTLPRSFTLEDLIGVGRVGLVEAARRYEPAQHGGAPFSAYARPVIRGTILNSVRRAAFREAKRPSIEASREPASHSFTEAAAAVDRGELELRIAAALRALPALQRSVVLLHYEEGLRLRAIASQFGFGKSRASAIHRAAIRSLRRRLTT